MLAPETEALWKDLQSASELSSFVLIGGSALSLRIGHRLSEDLDFATTATRLPADVLARFIESRPETWQRSDDPAAYDEFVIAGMDLHDYQQDFVVDGSVKVTFFTADTPLTKALDDAGDTEPGPRLARLDELFRSKAILSASRSRTRDWFDLYTLFTDHGFSANDYRDAFVRSSIDKQWEDGLARLCSGSIRKADEGYLHLAENAPSMEEMRGIFVEIRDELEQNLASENIENHPDSP